MQSRTIAVAPGDGIGPEIMAAVLRILDASGAPLQYETVRMGKDLYFEGHSTGMTPEAAETVERLGILLKGPMETPKGGGMKSINVTARKMWSTYANKRTFRSLKGVETVFSKAGIPVNLTLVRENIEDTYGGIEHMLTPDVAVGRRFITRAGSEQVHRYTFEMARRQGAKRVTCGHKANIMKLTDGLFLDTFRAIAKEYPDIQTDDIIVDDLAMKLVRRPDTFDVVVLPNLQGDVISDLCAGLVGGLGFAPSANIGDHVAIFEAVHGSAPDIAGKGIANPTALLLSAVAMLRHLHFADAASRIEAALFATLEEGFHTGDFGQDPQKLCNTEEFAAQIVKHLGDGTASTTGDEAKEEAGRSRPVTNRMMGSASEEGRTVGVDLFFESAEGPDAVGKKIEALLPEGLKLIVVSNRGTQVYPEGSVLTECVPHYCARVEVTDDVRSLAADEVLKIGQSLSHSFSLSSLEWLKAYGGKPAYSLAQGQ